MPNPVALQPAGNAGATTASKCSVWGNVATCAAALAGSILDDDTSVMDIGIVIGALVAAALAGRFRPSLRIPLRSLAAAVLGGLVLGYGSRIAFGCNIGAFFSGTASWCTFAALVRFAELTPARAAVSRDAF
ncbi:MAG: YeeE/YedE family protein [Rhodospirillales bacterium]|nr:YeeE/YedE family protein [Rhodospirillales bacterium]